MHDSNRANLVIEAAERLLRNPASVAAISRPAVREVFEHVATAAEAGFGYKKHGDHTKTSTKGCVMGCIGG